MISSVERVALINTVTVLGTTYKVENVSAFIHRIESLDDEVGNENL